MSFKDLEKMTKKVEDKHDAKSDVGQMKDMTAQPEAIAPKKTTRDAAQQGGNDDLFDNMPV